MKVLQINSVYNVSSTGTIVNGISDVIIASGNQSYIAFGCGNQKLRDENKFIINNSLEQKFSIFETRAFGLHGFYNKAETRRLIDWIDTIKPDIVHLHNIHGHYINSEILFKYLAKKNISIVWTLHDCWPFTGHCAHFESVKCDKWLTGCNNCVNRKAYPISYFFDRSSQGWEKKKYLFNLPEKNKMVFAATSDWVNSIQQKSFLSKYKCKTINNGIDTEVFFPERNFGFRKKLCADNDFLIIGVANKWLNEQNRKVVKFLNDNLPEKYKIVLIGFNSSYENPFPQRITTVDYITSPSIIRKYYSAADVFVNLTLEDTFPTVNIESLACGTPVITNDVCGSAEIIDEKTGIRVRRGNCNQLLEAILEIGNHPSAFYRTECRNRAIERYNKNNCYIKYLELYYELLSDGKSVIGEEK